MKCGSCGIESPTGARFCPSCGAALSTGSVSSGADSLHDVAREVSRAADELARTTARVSARLIHKAGTAAKDPPAAVRKGLHRVSETLDAAAKDLEKLLQDLK